MSVFDTDKIDGGILPIEEDTMKSIGFTYMWGTQWDSNKFIKTFIISSSKKKWHIDVHVGQEKYTKRHELRFATHTKWVPMKFRKTVIVKSIEDILDIMNQFKRWCIAHQKYIIY